ncbi:CbtA family protein [Halosimplex halobium]|uniref:CbtA family protein n=1 Tax=Halosimplex halobium TaxID=3396618 RepID=UPI003F569C1E
MFTAYLKRGVKAGAVAGLVFGVLVALVANPLVGFADALGHGGDHALDGRHDHASGEHHGAVSTAVTNGVSVVAGVLWGILLGGVVFGVVFYFLEPAVPGAGATKSYLLAAAGFVTVSGAPWLVLPPQPPGVAHALPTETRVVLYGGMMAAGALACLLAGSLYGRLRAARGRATAAVVATLPLCLLAVPTVLAPSNAVEHSLPAGLATGMTGVTVFGQVLLWLLLAGSHARFRRWSENPGASTVGTDNGDGALAAD